MRHSMNLFVTLVVLQVLCGITPSRAAESSAKQTSAGKQGALADASKEDAAATKLPESARAERMASKRPKDRTARLRAARAQLAAGPDITSHVESAQSHATAVLQENPNDVDALLLAAQASLLTNDLNNAMRYYRAAAQADVNNASAHLGLGDVLTRLGDEAGATAAFARYRQLQGMPALSTTNRTK